MFVSTLTSQSTLRLSQRRRWGQWKAYCHTVMLGALAYTTPSHITLTPGRPDIQTQTSVSICDNTKSPTPGTPTAHIASYYISQNLAHTSGPTGRHNLPTDMATPTDMVTPSNMATPTNMATPKTHIASYHISENLAHTSGSTGRQNLSTDMAAPTTPIVNTQITPVDRLTSRGYSELSHSETKGMSRASPECACIQPNDLIKDLPNWLSSGTPDAEFKSLPRVFSFSNEAGKCEKVAKKNRSRQIVPCKISISI
ncbi:hypothetical protein ElyMa_003895900 [Elysia marginata]|uniref:Uncharacterized protein n=1 Tax=Elysia marginata TaxID=1093978 RepID=A0AAV4FML6_9GAST|nr:hypothetical protein ElyMa_003895900 [Elysia marginata]